MAASQEQELAGTSASSPSSASSLASALPGTTALLLAGLGGSSPGGSLSPGGGATAQAAPSGQGVVQDAMRYLGVPYLWGGTTTAGFDCSGLVQKVYSDLGIALPRTSEEQATVGQAVPSLNQAQPGDLVFYGSPAEHVGIYIGNGEMINAPHTGTDVQVDPVGNPTSIRRVLPTNGSSLLASGSPAQGAPSPELSALFSAAEQRYGLPAGILQSVAQVESGFNSNAVSPVGAEGLMQLMPSTAASLGVNPFDPAQAVDGAARLLSSDLGQFGSLPLAIAAYNAGAGAVSSYGGVPPYPQTQQYVAKVLSLMGLS